MARLLFRTDLLAARPSAANSVAHVLTEQVPSSYPRSGDLSRLYAEIETPDGEDLPRGELEVDAHGRLPRFIGPDGATSLFVLYADASGPPYTAVEVEGVADPADQTGTSVPVPADPADDGKVLTADGGEYVLAVPSSGSSPDHFLGVGASSFGLADGADHYPNVTIEDSSGSSIVLDADNQTLHTAAGFYDVSFSAAFAWAAAGSVELTVWFDGLPAVFSTTWVEHPAGTSRKVAFTVQGVPLYDPADILVNAQVTGGGLWDWSGTRFSLRRVGDIPA